MPEQLPHSLQENLLTLLAYDDEHGKLVANMAEPAQFEDIYSVVAERLIAYWHQYKIAPKLHTPDLFEDFLADEHNTRGKSMRRILLAMLHLSEGLNTKHVLNQIKTHTRLRELQTAILEAANTLGNNPQGTTIEQAEEILAKIMHARDIDFDRGIRLSNYERLLHKVDAVEEFQTGIAPLDINNIVPKRGTMMVLLAPTNYGKTWFLVQIGKRAAVVERKKVVHITLELSEDEILMRYYQSIFAATEHAADRVKQIALEVVNNRLIGFESTHIDVDFHFKSRSLPEELRTHVTLLGQKMENVIIKRFPQRQLTVGGVRTFLDQLESVDNFIPDMLIIDYPQIMKTDPKNIRTSLGALYGDLFGLLVERNLAGVFVHQASKEGAEARQLTSRHVSEDWSIIHTSDIVLTHSATKQERENGLARIFVDKSRSAKGNFGFLITQNYNIGQYVIDTAPLSKGYFDLVSDLKSPEDSEDEDDNTDGDGD